MFELRITTLHEFRLFVKLIKDEQISEEEIKALLPSLEDDTKKLLATIDENKKVR